jgi:hypothetical protein
MLLVFRGLWNDGTSASIYREIMLKNKSSFQVSTLVCLSSDIMLKNKSSFQISTLVCLSSIYICNLLIVLPSYIRNKYILKLPLNVVTTRIEAFVVSGNKFLYACVEEVWRLWAQPRVDTFLQLLITAETLWSQPVLQIGTSKQVVTAWSEIRAVRRVIKKLAVEMVQQL